jgi:hypothetical protein
MLALEPCPGPFIRIRATGLLGASDYRGFEPAFAAELKRRNLPIPLLLDMRGFRGWTPAGLVRDLGWDLRNRRTFSRIAVIGDAPWHRWITAAGAPLFRAPMRYFPAGEQAEAEAWLISASAR